MCSSQIERVKHNSKGKWIAGKCISQTMKIQVIEDPSDRRSHGSVRSTTLVSENAEIPTILNREPDSKQTERKTRHSTNASDPISSTLDGIKIDSRLERLKHFDPSTRIEHGEINRINRRAVRIENDDSPNSIGLPLKTSSEARAIHATTIELSQFVIIQCIISKLQMFH
jgi:hypothetical protein